MQFTTLALGLFAALASAQNAFIVPTSGTVYAAGDSTTLEWDPTTNGTVSLRLQWGTTTTASDGVAIACESALYNTYLDIFSNVVK
jgi:Ser-Thr-rich glycosyl-phosphatidyl-inositol-anchored membrane family